MTKTALVTGASSGIGYEMVQLLARDGYDLILVARNEQRLQQIKEALPDRKVTVLVQDLSAPGAAESIDHRVREAQLNVDILVNDAGFGLVGAFYSLGLDVQMKMIQLNVAALTELTYRFLQDMRQNGGKILNVASTAAYQPGPFMAVYFASKAYVLSLTEALAEELNGTRVSVTALCPGPTHTNFGAVANAADIRMFARTMDAHVVAQIGYRALQKGKRVAIAGGMNRSGALAAKLLPSSWGAKAVRFVTGKKK
ncbi:MAG: SDR family oxidoreductase [Sporolactobacillus sp.]